MGCSDRPGSWTEAQKGQAADLYAEECAEADRKSRIKEIVHRAVGEISYDYGSPAHRASLGLLPPEKPVLRSDKEIAERPSFDVVYMTLALQMARRSTCRRLAVGCVITTIDHRRVLSVGYNGNAKGLPNHCDGDEPGKCGCLHAECNAIINCTSDSHVFKLVYATHLPCVMCAKQIVNLGQVATVYYNTDYRIQDSKKLLESVGIHVYQIEV